MSQGSFESVYWKLEKAFRETRLSRPQKVQCYETGTELDYEITGVESGQKGSVRLVVEKFVGGGFAGQVYQVRVLSCTCKSGSIPGIKEGALLAIKILVPPSSFSRFFRNVLYWIGFQAPFQLQVNPAASRSGALWQKFIRRGAKVWFGDERSVVDIYATFLDKQMGSCGEISEWVEGRTWYLEANDHLDFLKRWLRKKKQYSKKAGSPEFRAKYEFMNKFVELLHAVGAHEFARQYEWSTCKSQPNCLKRKDTEKTPDKGLVAVDFRAGLALLPFLPMSPGDFKLIFQGLLRGSLVQFDRGNIAQLEEFIRKHPAEFSGTERMLEELKKEDRTYRNSIIDITHNHVRLLYDLSLWRTIFNKLVTGWHVRDLINKPCEEKLRSSKIKVLMFGILGWIPLLGKVVRRIWGQPLWRAHYKQLVTSFSYLGRAFCGGALERIINWHRAERVDDAHALKLKGQMWRCIYHVPLSILPVGLHRLMTDFPYAKERLYFFFIRPVRLYFNADLRSEWLREMVLEGRKKHMLTEEEEKTILSQIKEPFIQKYLQSLAVHICTLPVTQIISVAIAIIYVMLHPDMPRHQAYSIGLGIIALFQVVPVSPGSLVRGLYVVYLVIKERNFKDYNIAVFLGFFKYIGYLSFPIQMTYRYPALARFMAGHWATEAVYIVPVFGEKGALLEHSVFDKFYNFPLTVRRKISERSELRAGKKAHNWPVALFACIGSALFLLVDLFGTQTGEVIGFHEV